MGQRIVITGEGIISSIGNDKQEVCHSLRNGISGIRGMKYLNSTHTELPVGEVQLSNKEIKERLNIPSKDVISRTALLGIWAVKQAIKEAHLNEILSDNKDKIRVLLISGTTVGGMDITEKEWHTLSTQGPHTDILNQHDCGSCTQIIADYFGCFSDYATISTACSSAANAIIFGADLIKAGRADMVIAGGTEALTKFHLNGFNSLMILDKEMCRPFDETRSGLNLGEGAGYIVIESEESAIKRGVSIHGYLSGYGNACDAYHQTASSENGEGAYLAMTQALKMSGLNKDEIQYVNAHGTGTPNNDLSESVALKRFFSNNMPLISSTKMYTGHTTSASGGIECVICLLALQNQFVPANIGWKNQMPNGITPTLGKENVKLTHVFCNSFGFGGNDSSLILSSEPTNGEIIDFEKKKKITVLSRVEISNVDELDDIKRFVKPMEARRMGKLMKSSLLSSFKALEEANITMPDAIITGTWWGCLENSELLMNQMEDNGEAMIKPTLFMQSTHNTIGGNIAIHTQCHGYNITFTQKEKSLEWAMTNAELLLQSKKAKVVLVGLHNETTPMFRKLLSEQGLENFQEIESLSLVLSCGDC